MAAAGTTNLLIYDMILLIFIASFYIYGLIKWVSFQRHFLIYKRFPAISNCIIAVTLLSTINYMIGLWIEYKQNHEISDEDPELLQLFNACVPANAFLIASMSAYRLFLVYLRWKRLQCAVHEINKTDLAEYNISDTSISDNESNKKRKNIYKHPASTLLIISVLIAYIINLFRKQIDLFQRFVPIMWTIWIIMVVALIILIKYKHVTDGIGCLRETYITLLYVMMTFIFIKIEAIAPLFDYFKTTLLPFPGLLSIYISLYYINKFEGSLDAVKWKKHRQSAPTINLSLMTTTSDIKIVVQEPTSNQSETENKNENETNEIITDLELPLFLFLTKQENYKAFTAHLAYCFCLENILFFERVSILYQIVNEYKKSESQRKLSENMYTDDREHAIERVKFTFLQQIYFEYTNKISKLNMKYNNMENADIDHESIDYYKKALYTVYQSIYDEFVEDGSKNQINISAQTRQDLQYLFSDENMVDKFQSFNDFLYVFDTALIEICQLLLQIYGYKFKHWFINNS